MSRWNLYNKTETDCLPELEIWWLRKQGLLGGFKSAGIKWGEKWNRRESSIWISVMTMSEKNKDGVRFQYVQNDRFGNEKIFDYRAGFTTTPCNYGGERYWFLCPLCYRRVGVLYKKGDYFRCRHCHDLTYASKNQGYSVTSMSELESMRKNIKIKYYKGKITRKYKRFLMKERRNYAILARYSE